MEPLAINSENTRINIVYYGAGVVGKTTNLYYIYSNFCPHVKGEVIIQYIEGRYPYLFFDFVTSDERYFGKGRTAFRLHCLAGSVRERRTKEQQMFMNVNAVVFVADSQTERLEANLEALELLIYHLGQQGHTPKSIPWVIQYNKRDLPEILPIDELQRQLNSYNVPYFEAVATQGIGVLETLKTMLQRVATHVGE